MFANLIAPLVSKLNLGRLAIVAVAALAVVGVGFFAIQYVSGLQADVAIAKANAEKATAALVTQAETITALQQDSENIALANQSLSATVNTQQREIRELRSKFNTSSATRQARDFGAIAAANPVAVERVVNRASTNAARCMELASGAVPTAAEAAATTLSTINPLCPSLANPNYVPGQ